MSSVNAPLATVDDVAQAYEADISADGLPRVQGLLEYASARLERLRPALRADLAAGSVDPVLVQAALVQAVLRVLRNPGAYQSQTAGEFSYTLNTRVASGQLAFTDDELADCSPLPVAHARPQGVGSIRLGVSLWRAP
ncbi:Gp19/Gp15/Gp42 family protein [Enterococcus hirae]|uniref:Gp19/Gp15/Gp42 family protein n=1 Tax=Enterococcus hirae TaxID=1354 RepID=UPI0013698D0F|nr:Gp19/Gp15/Gp42 family protein [Enterococcus hirae]NAE18050.1 hypothetical protein [Enterococcus hirae]